MILKYMRHAKINTSHVKARLWNVAIGATSASLSVLPLKKNK